MLAFIVVILLALAFGELGPAPFVVFVGAPLFVLALVCGALGG
jgi:hypothetical protein